MESGAGDTPMDVNSVSTRGPVIYIEILRKRNSNLPKEFIQKHVEKILGGSGGSPCSKKMLLDFCQFPELQDDIQSVYICNDEDESSENIKWSVITRITRSLFDFRNLSNVSLKGATLHYRTYSLNYDGPGVESLDNAGDLAAAHHWMLPALEFHGMWENLIYDCEIKTQLLNFASTTLLFSDKKVESNVITWNRVVLLHGPPGTGKTSLCKALAQKLCIRLSDRFAYGQLVEINSHSLFSKWFSESGKLVMLMFEKIHELLNDSSALVFVLIDEVESLAHVRKMSCSGNEPSDAIRVVNAVLTQIDLIKQYPNALILTTSNVTGAIDLALVDRADIKQYIGLPSVGAITRIYESCIAELQRVGIIDSNSELIFERLKEIANFSVGLSGRTLRKLPFLAHALYIQKSTCTMHEFLDALQRTAERQFQDVQDLDKT